MNNEPTVFFIDSTTISEISRLKQEVLNAAASMRESGSLEHRSEMLAAINDRMGRIVLALGMLEQKPGQKSSKPYKLVAQRIEGEERRVLGEYETEADADSAVRMAVLKRGVEEEFFFVERWD